MRPGNGKSVERLFQTGSPNGVSASNRGYRVPDGWLTGPGRARRAMKRLLLAAGGAGAEGGVPG
jgi:hypothetical protein